MTSPENLGESPAKSTPNINATLAAKLQALYAESTHPYLALIREALEPHLPTIVDQFYTELLLIPELQPVLSHNLVHKSLKAHLQRWLKTLTEPDNTTQICQLLERQGRIGVVHANTNVRLDQFMFGLSILKRETYQYLFVGLANHSAIDMVCFTLEQIFDILVTIISQAYFSHEIGHEQNEFSLRLKGFTKNTAIECERLRSSLLDWLRNALNLLYQTPNLQLETLPKLRQANFGLWVLYKADLISPSSKVPVDLKKQIEDIDHALLQAARHRIEGTADHFIQSITILNELVSKTSWYLANLADELIELDTGMDHVTRLFNRRYLETIIRRQTEIARQTGFPYALILFDLDYFKQVNDQFGHANGDAILKQFAELLLFNTRTSDFAFRYGGEEFLVIMGNADQATALAQAERIRQNCADFNFAVSTIHTIHVTCSAGIAVYDGHPDPNQLLSSADRALYQAKEQGRNRVC